ncbi:MAG: tRNA lysidine(34) synthetase TilS [Gemmatimonadota bacterium]
MSESLERRFGALLERHPQLLPPSSRVLVAFSGGPDSTALLALLSAVREAHGFDLVAAHFDHGLRPDSADEARRVAGWARGLGVPCEVGRAPRGIRPRQAELRAARYAFLERVAAALGADRIATGHQADDQAETVLFRLFRGSDLRGLSGIPVRRGRIVRPLLGFWRGEIREYLRLRGLSYLEDPSNRDPRWMRTRLRLLVIPALEEVLGPEVRRRLVALGRTARRAERVLEAAAVQALAECVEPADPASDAGSARGGARPESAAPAALDSGAGAVTLDRSALLRHPDEIRARVLRRLCRVRGVALTRGGTRAGMEFMSRGRSGGRVDLGGGLALGREFGQLVLYRPSGPSPSRKLSIPGPRAGEGSLELGGRSYLVRWGRRSSAPPSPLRVALPAEHGQFPLELRSWEPGDRIRLPGGTRKLKRLFGDRRIPRSRREGIPVLADASGRVLWVVGLVCDRDVEAFVEQGEAFVIELSE